MIAYYFGLCTTAKYHHIECTDRSLLRAIFNGTICDGGSNVPFYGYQTLVKNKNNNNNNCNNVCIILCYLRHTCASTVFNGRGGLFPVRPAGRVRLLSYRTSFITNVRKRRVHNPNYCYGSNAVAEFAAEQTTETRRRERRSMDR